jgi:type I site-specific restriction-modification system R (restriction) subunit
MHTLLQSIRESIQKISQKTDEMTRVGRLKIAIIATKRDIEKKMIELGDKIYQLAKEEELIDLKKHSDIETVIKEINEMEQKLDKLKREVERIKIEDGVDLD